MADYVLDHHLEGEARRLSLMSALLDPMHRRRIEELGVVGPGARTLEVGCGNGSVSTWLAGLVEPAGQAVALDIDLSLVGQGSGVEWRKGDILDGPVEPLGFDLVTARAVLHHIEDPDAAIANMVASLRPGGAILLIEPDFLPVSVSEPDQVHAFWRGWLGWAQKQGIDYYIGRSLAPRLSHLGLEDVDGAAETAVYSGGSPWADYWVQTVTELRDRLVGSGELDAGTVDAFLTQNADRDWWTQTIAFTGVSARAPAA